MYYIYVLRSGKDNKNYIGYTKDIKRRIREHLLGEVNSTKSRRPLEIIYYEQFETSDEAVKREKYLKSGIGRQKLKTILNNNIKK